MPISEWLLLAPTRIDPKTRADLRVNLGVSAGSCIRKSLALGGQKPGT